MALFEYQAVDRTGKRVKGKVDAANLKQATGKLQAGGLFVEEIKEARAGLLPGPGKKARSKSNQIPSQVITAFTRQMSILVSTGIPYDKALELLIDEAGHPPFQQVLSAIKAMVLEGSSLAAAMEPHPKVFPRMFVAMVRAGEAGGRLGQVLEQMSKFREEQEQLKHKIQGALIYPAIMTVIGLAIVIFMITFILPKIVPIFQQFDVALPLPTRVVIFVSDLVVDHWFLLLLTLGAMGFVLLSLARSRKGELFLHRQFLALPFFGKNLRKVVIFRYVQTLGTLLSSGVELKQALEIVRHVLGNRVYEDSFDQMITEITKKGLDLSQAMKNLPGLYPASVIQMIRVGEETSKLEDMLTNLASSLDREVKQAIEKSIALLEPVMILWMAVMVGFIVLAVMLPMFAMNQLI